MRNVIITSKKQLRKVAWGVWETAALPRGAGLPDRTPRLLCLGVFCINLTDLGKRAKINEILEHEGGIAMACEAMIHITREDRERARKLSEDKYILDTQSMRVSAWKEGRQEGLQEGRGQGRKEGLQEGREEGLQKAALEIARKLKSDDIPVSQIVKYTNLTEQQIENL